MITETPYAAATSDVRESLLLDILAEAFDDDPISRWIFPDAEDRRRYLPTFFSTMLAHPWATRRTIDSSAAAIWITVQPCQPHAEEDPPDETASGGAAAPFGANGQRLRALGTALASSRPAVETYDYLFAIGVLPQCRGAGVGTALLKEGLRRADTARRGVYLEASSPGSRTLYLRHGFADLAAPVHLEDGPPVWPMWRPAVS
ncbi:GNAT family N-acetyltransferase [Microlunatus soli]|uniref:Acetyltransferase (GNAT) family protein n=1 Tax=Microlunatus soli TaxID=630515 RepID=A0A1H2A4Y8_9ACTN|nr:GNAT family N-acetyltransferase [Microlunatus soli]SDT41025.1 Acetyltransferase (GNAT) family protein [Microlunatus soli]